MRTYEEAVARARELTAGDGRERYVWWNYSRDNPGEYKYSAKRPTRRKDRSHAIIMADGTIDVGFGYGAPRNYGMRPLNVMGRQVKQSRFSYLASIANAFPECRPQVAEMSVWVRDVDDIDSENYPHRETLKANLMRSVYDIAQCINRNA